MCISIAAPAFAEAPVYDADAMPQDQSYGPPPDQAQYQPAVPPLGQEEGGGGFVPMQPQSSVTVSSPALAEAPAPASSLSLEQRLQRLEQQAAAAQPGDTNTRVESLQNQVQSLRGQIEQLTHQLELVQAQQKNQYSDLDSRITQASAAKSSGRVSVAPALSTDAAPPAVKIANKTTVKSRAEIVNSFAAKPTGSQPNMAEEQQIYQSAYNLIKAKKYSEAVSTLQSMLKKYPSGQFASNAHYWLGELYGLLGKSDQALTEFAAVVKTYPDSPRVSDAQLKVGLIYASELKWPDAKAALKQVISHYPGSPSARLASEQLKQIKQAGH